LCLHTAKHAWVRLSWLCDIAATVRTQPVNWPQVRMRAEELGIQRIVGVSLWLVERLLEIALPAQMQEDLHRDPAIAAIAEQLLPIISGTAEFDTESVAYFRLMLRAWERKRDQLRFLWRLAVTPGESEWSVVRLPATLFPFYRVIRLGRLASKVFFPSGP